MTRWLPTLLLAAATALGAICAPNLQHDLAFRHLEVADGLSNSCVRTIEQDGRGFMWFGTDEGLDLYDGTAFRHFIVAPEGANNYVSALLSVGDVVYVGTDHGLYRFNPASESAERVDVTTSAGVSIASLVAHIVTDLEGGIWVATQGQGVFRYNPRTGSLHQYNQLSPNFVRMLVDTDNQVWGLPSSGSVTLARFDKARNRFQPVSNGTVAKSMSIMQDSDGRIWLGTWDSGLQLYHPHHGVLATFLKPSSHPGLMHIHTIMEYAPHQLLVGSDEGLIHLDTSTGKWHLYTEDEARRHALTSRFVYALKRDHEGGVWIGTFFGGVNYLPPNSGQFNSFAYARGGNTVSGNVISQFCEDNRGDIWIGSDDGGLSRYTPSTGRFTHFSPPINGLQANYYNVHALMADGDDLWIGTYAGGVDRLNIPSGRFTHYASVHDAPLEGDGRSCYAISKDCDGRLWFGSMSCISIYDPATDSFQRMKNVGAVTIDIKQGPDGRLWFATQGSGLYSYDHVKGEWRNYRADKLVGSLPNNHVNSILTSTNNTLWVGTMDGLCRYNPSTDGFETVDLPVPNSNICAIIEDNGLLWLTTSKGLVRYQPEVGACEVFYQSDGLRHDQFQPNSAIKTSDGCIYVGTVSGFNSFYPYKISPNRYAPRVYITGVEIFNTPVEVGGNELPTAPAFARDLKLAHDRNSLTLDFAALSYCIPEKNSYSYKLEGYDKDWNNVGPITRATYPKLPPGNYTFRVKASNNDGVWSDREAVIDIRVSPPLYATLPFKLLYLLLGVVAVLLLIYWVYKSSQRRYNEEVRQIKERRDRDVMEERLRFFTMIAHEIRTPVSLIIGPLEKVMKSYEVLPKPVKAEMSVLERNSQRLLYLVNQLLDFRKIEDGKMRMNFKPHNVAETLRSVIERFEPTLRHQDTRLEVDYTNADFEAEYDVEALTKVISNLLTNASKYTVDLISVNTSRNDADGTFSVMVTDNGIGISKDEQEKIFRTFYQVSEHKQGTGIGLSLVRNIASLHEGRVTVDSEPGHGSTFTVTLPLRQPGVEHDEALQGEPTTDDQNEAVETASKPVATEHPTMLIVDDNEELLSFLTSSFADTYKVKQARNGREAIEMLQGEGGAGVSVIVTDWMMPEMDGPELVKAVRMNADISHIPVILLTAKTDVRSKIEGMEVMADLYIEKPFSMKHLEASVKNLIEMRRRLFEKYSHTPLATISEVTEAAPAVESEFLLRLTQLIEDNIANPELSVDFLAEEMAISRSGLFAKIKSLTDITPGEMIQLVRLKRGAQLIKEGRYRISEICFMVGFNSPSYFTKCFQRQFDVKPSEFAKRSAH